MSEQKLLAEGAVILSNEAQVEVETPVVTPPVETETHTEVPNSRDLTEALGFDPLEGVKAVLLPPTPATPATPPATTIPVPQTAKGRDKLPEVEAVLSVLPFEREHGLTNGEIRAKLNMRLGRFKTHLHSFMQGLAADPNSGVRFWYDGRANHYYRVKNA